MQLLRFSSNFLHELQNAWRRHFQEGCQRFRRSRWAQGVHALHIRCVYVELEPVSIREPYLLLKGVPAVDL